MHGNYYMLICAACTVIITASVFTQHGRIRVPLLGYARIRVSLLGYGRIRVSLLGYGSIRVTEIHFCRLVFVNHL